MLFCTSAFCTQQPSWQPIYNLELNDKTKAKLKKLSLLFTIESSRASLTHISGNTFLLSIPTHSIQSVLVFSDRPNRFSTYISPDNYADIVHKGRNTFDTNPPNIVIAFGDSNPALAFTIKSFKKHEYTINYKLTLLTKVEDTKTIGYSGKVSLFIDNQDAELANAGSNILMTLYYMVVCTLGALLEAAASMNDSAAAATNLQTNTKIGSGACEKLSQTPPN